MLTLFQLVYRLLTLLLCGIGLFLSAWIVFPAPTFFLLPLGVGAPEVSPWLLGLNGIATLLSLPKLSPLWLRRFALSCGLVGLILSALPLLQVPMTEQQAKTAMQKALGADYLESIPSYWQAQMRPQPFVLTDTFRGIPSSKVRHTSGIRFAAPDGVPLSLEVYRPPQVGKYPALIVIYGGAWQNGSPTQHAKFNDYMAARGYTVVAIDYRHAPRYRFPTQVEDVQTALAFIHQHATEYEVDWQRIALVGRSAGAHLAMLAAYQTKIPILAVVDYYGPVDLTAGYSDPPHPDPINTRAVLEAFIGGSPQELPISYQNASPINYVRKSLPPTLLIYGGRDHIVQAKFGQSLYDRLRTVGNTAVFLEIPWAEHEFDAIFNGISNQLALYYTERFLGWALK